MPLKPFDKWRKGVDKESLIAEINDALEKAFPGVEFTFSQYIQDNVQEAASGVKGENSVKVYRQRPRDAGQGRRRHQERHRHGAGRHRPRGLRLARPADHPHRHRPHQGARYGLAPGDINATVQAAIGGQAAGDVYENGSDRHFPMVVRLAPRYRENLEAIKRIPIGAQTDKGVTQVPLSEVANVALVSGAFYIYREQQERYVPVKFSVRGRDLGSAVLEAQQRVAEKVKIPGGYRVEWVGEFGNLKSALHRLADRRADRHRADPAAALCQLRQPARHAAGRQRHPDGVDRRRAGAFHGRHALQHLRRHRLRRPVRHRRHERHHGAVLLQPPDRMPASSARKPCARPARCRCGRC